tara:strand:- start:12648 stop:16916 length:4269 start_codon:yes stop_codon:yes gene_type:complete
MAGKTAPAKPAATRRTATNGGAPATRRNTKPGNPGYAGYEYQITVTVWVALDLMLVKTAATEIQVEPRSDEDIEAAVNDPATGLSEASAKTDAIELVIQAKTRSGSPWTAPAIADVLLGKAPSGKGSGGKRSRPLEMLEADPARRYVFVTNESLAEGLRPHEGEHLLDFPDVDKLPPHARAKRTMAQQAELAPRIVLLSGVTVETLKSRIVTQLERHSHVASPAHEECIRDLRDLVRDKIRGQNDGVLTRDEVINILVRHGGSIAPTRDMDHYVRPASYEEISRRLRKQHVVVIAGPSGTGKTLTADILELELRAAAPPFSVIGEENGPSQIRANLTRADPVVFHLRDPWGGNRLTPDADRWSGELPKLLQQAGPGRKFIVTSRSDVLRSAGSQVLNDLDPYIERIEVEDYGPEKIAEIYDGIASDLRGHARTLATTFRDDAIASLGRPYEVSRFLVSLGREDPEEPRPIAELVAESQIEAISHVVADQVSSFGTDGIQGAAIIWSMLIARSAVPDDVFTRLARRLRTIDPSFRPDVQGLLDFLQAGRNLKRDGAALSFAHPRVEDGLLLALRAKSGEAEFSLGLVVQALVAWDAAGQDWGRETALAMLRRASAVEEIDPEIPDATRDRLQEFLVSAALGDGGRLDFERALRDLIRFGSPTHLPTKLARILLEGAENTKRPSFGPGWTAPEITEEDVASLRADPATAPLIKRFIGEILPFTPTDYSTDIVDIIDTLVPGISDEFWGALSSVEGPGGPSSNMEPILRGALREEAPDYDRAIEAFAKSEESADAWMEKSAEGQLAAEEHAMDADAADHELEEPGDTYHNARSGLEKIVALRKGRDGVDFIHGHPRAELLTRALAEVLKNSPDVDVDDLRQLLGLAEGWVRDYAWAAVREHWDAELEPDLIAELARPDIEGSSLRERLVEIATRHRPVDPVPVLEAAASAATVDRRLELVRDVMTTSWGDGSRGAAGAETRLERVHALADSYPSEEQALARALADVMSGKRIDEVADALDDTTRGRLAERLAHASTDVAQPLVLLAAFAGVEVGDAVATLLATGDTKNGQLALRALRIADPADLRERMTDALGHKRYKVRREALQSLVPDAADPEERERLVTKASGDASADVRLAFAEMMADHRWPESIAALVTLVADDRNFATSMGMGNSWPRFAVARAAAAALGKFEALPTAAIDELLAFAAGRSVDPFVAPAALLALAKKDDARIALALLSSLEAPGLRSSPAHRPAAQGGAWALFDRAYDGKIEDLGSAMAFAASDGPTVAGPLLMAAGMLTGPGRNALLAQLERNGHQDRAVLVRLIAIASGRADGLDLDERERLLSRLAGDGPGLSDDERSLLEDWSKGLDLDGGFEPYAAWIANKALDLPLAGGVVDVRAFDLPDTISVMTMRSMSPYREELPPDDGR